MNLFRIVQKRTSKSKREDSPYRDVGAILLFVFLLPYVISCLCGNVGEETDAFFDCKSDESLGIDTQYEVNLSASWGTRRINMREYLIRKLEIIMPQGTENETQYELEVLKAQAVLLRTELWRLYILNDGSIAIEDDVTLYSYDKPGESIEETVYERAVKETDGIYLIYEGSPIKAAFFPVSGGQTRCADEVWQNNEYPYLVSVECSQDIQSDKYQSRNSLSKEEYCRLIKELFDINGNEQDLWNIPNFTYDSAGYVMEADFHGNKCNGETFRNRFGLSSACFQIQMLENSVEFHVKGVGHGFGMSQYGADKRAVSGETFDQILKYYFFNTELAKIE